MSPLSSTLSMIQVFGIPLILIFFLSRFVRRAAAATPAGSTTGGAATGSGRELMRTAGAPESSAWIWMTPVVLCIWFISANLIGYRVGLTVGTQFTLAGVLQMAVPMIGGTLLLFFSKPLNRLLARMPEHWLIYIQVYRTVGVFLLYLYFHEQYFSRGFALYTGGGDMFIGLTALLVGRWVSVKGKGYQVAAVVWNILGIIDLVVAPISARTYGAQGITVYPMVLVPLFLGPPLGIFLHLASLRNLYLRSRRD